jgi:hypothetical protein
LIQAAVGLSGGSGGFLPERKRQFAKPTLHAVRLDVREILTVHTRCAHVGPALGIGMRQDIPAADLDGVDGLSSTAS